MLHPADDGQQARNSVALFFLSGVTHTLLSCMCVYNHTAHACLSCAILCCVLCIDLCMLCSLGEVVKDDT